MLAQVGLSQKAIAALAICKILQVTIFHLCASVNDYSRHQRTRLYHLIRLITRTAIGRRAPKDLGLVAHVTKEYGMSNVRLFRGILHVVALAVLLAVETAAQQSDAAPTDAKQEKVAALKQSLAQNQAALKTYSWTETTQISLKGEVKKQEQKQCQYGPDGKVQKTAMPGAEPSSQPQQESAGHGRRGGAMKKAVVEKKVDEMKDYMQQVAALVHEYVPPNPQKIQAAQSAGNVAAQPAAGGLIALTIKNYAKQGDSLALGFDPTAKKLRSYDVTSYLKDPKDDAVKLAVTFASLPDGTNYPAESMLDATGKKIQVKVTNSGYKKVGQ